MQKNIQSNAINGGDSTLIMDNHSSRDGHYVFPCQTLVA